jgi:hypothetical protein
MKPKLKRENKNCRVDSRFLKETFLVLVLISWLLFIRHIRVLNRFADWGPSTNTFNLGSNWFRSALSFFAYNTSCYARGWGSLFVIGIVLVWTGWVFCILRLGVIGIIISLVEGSIYR